MLQKCLTTTNGHYEVALKVDNYKDVDKTYGKVTEAGAESIMEPQIILWEQRTCYISDPEGNLIEIGSFEK